MQLSRTKKEKKWQQKFNTIKTSNALATIQ
jgi:hypothetical protein